MLTAAGGGVAVDTGDRQAATPPMSAARTNAKMDRDGARVSLSTDGGVVEGP
jgi:hypothetical protein